MPAAQPERQTIVHYVLSLQAETHTHLPYALFMAHAIVCRSSHCSCAAEIFIAMAAAVWRALAKREQLFQCLTIISM
jgi:hypothetical protein